MRKIVMILLLFVYTKSRAQKTIMQDAADNKYYRAVELYNSKNYAGAQKLFIEVSKTLDKESNLKTNADYYSAMCAIKLDQTYADEKVLKFVKDNPYSNKKQSAYLNVGNYYFANRKASHALKWYTKVNEKLLTGEKRDELNYKMGYALLVSNYLADAKERFSTLLGSAQYGNDARYYYGYISYKQENFGEAASNFSQLANHASYKSKANYYLLDIAFKNGDFKQAVEIGEKILPNPEKGKKSDIVKIIGESYFNLGKYELAIPYLLQYKDMRGKWNNTDLYYIGYAYYQQKDYENAVKYFTKIINGNNTLAQNAYYHLGDCYLRQNKKTEALNAFKNASEMHFNKEIADDAALNYTKLSYEGGNPYKSVPDVLKEYLAQHPNSENSKEVQELLITSYLHEGDYQGAIDYLRTNQNFENNNLALEVSLYRGIQLINEKKFKESAPHFLIASSSENDTIKNKALFWMAESDYLLNNYKNSIIEFLSVDRSIKINEIENLDYNIGYAYFKQKKYNDAADYFKRFLSNINISQDLKDDTTTRLGDCYYADKNYNEAIKMYDIIIQQGAPGSDYAIYQKAMSNGLLGNKSEKINNLEKLVDSYPNSDYKDDAYFQIAKAHTKLNQNYKAHKYYDKLVSQIPSSSYIPNAILSKGLLFYNDDDNQNALLKFKEVVNKFPSSAEAKQAVTNARNVYVDLNDIDSYVAWVNSLAFVNVSNREIDDSSFLAIENNFLNGDYITSIKGFNSYIQKFPEGAHLLKANYYLAESYMNSGLSNLKNAIPHYSYVISQEKNEYTEDSLVKLSKIFLENSNWKEAIATLEKLEKNANKQKNILFAESNLMKGYYEAGKYEKAKKYAEKVLSSHKLDQVLDEDAKLIIARCAIVDKDYRTAREYYEIVDQTATDKVKAETLYYKAMFLYEDKLYEESNVAIQNLIANYSNHKYWGVKSYIIMAKNYYALNDAYQASYILKSVIENFSEFKDLAEEANNELRKIKNEEAKTNESINTK